LVTIGTAHIALGDLSGDSRPTAVPNQAADVHDFVGAIAMIEMQDQNVAVPAAVSFGLFGEHGTLEHAFYKAERCSVMVRGVDEDRFGGAAPLRWWLVHVLAS
jgi:hypothetical protein